jgi:hypothetical protein
MLSIHVDYSLRCPPAVQAKKLHVIYRLAARAA